VDDDEKRPLRHGGVPQHGDARNEQTGERVFDSFATGAGIGARRMLNKRSKTNLCFDLGFGRDGSPAVLRRSGSVLS
jgi:hypothetical protein